MTEINKYLKHVVSINVVTYLSGSRTVAASVSVPAFITQRNVVDKDVGGDHESTETVVYLKASQAVSEQDEIVVDGFARPIKRIWPARNLRGIHHKRVILS